jgi:hypothetical protein
MSELIQPEGIGRRAPEPEGASSSRKRGRIFALMRRAWRIWDNTSFDLRLCYTYFTRKIAQAKLVVDIRAETAPAPWLVVPPGTDFGSECVDFAQEIRVGNLEPHERITRILKIALESD